MITSRLIISGIDYSDFKDLKVENTVSENIASSYFSTSLDNTYGRHAGQFNVGNDVKVYAGPGHLNGLISHWRYNQSGTKTQDEFNFKSGGVAAGVAFVSTGILGSALSFDNGATSFVSHAKFNGTGSYYDLDPSGTHTVTFWANVREEANGAGFFTSLYNGIVLAPEFYLDTSDNYFKYLLPDGGTFITVSGLKLQSLTGSWSFLACAYNGINGSAYIYQNGSLVKAQSVGTLDTQYNAGVAFRIGQATNSGYFTSGIIDDFRVYKTALTEGQIKQLYNNGSCTLDFMLNSFILEDVGFEGESLIENVRLEGRDYSARLGDVTVQPVVFTNVEIGSIVKTIISNNVSDITTQNVSGTSIVLPRMAYNHKRVSDAINELAQQAGYITYVDKFKDLHFEPRQSIISNLTLGSENILNISFDSTRKGMSNKIWVYGDRYLSAAPIERLNVGSPNVGGNLGSVFTLTYKPHNTNASILGSVRGIYQLTNVPVSGITYLINFEDKQLIFPSGTTFGYYMPPSGGSIIVNYDRDLAVVKYGQSDTSIAIFGPKEEVILDKSIKDPRTAEDIITSKVNDADPLLQITTNYKGWNEIIPSQTVNLKMNDFAINQSGISVLSVNYNLNNESIYIENPISLRLSRKVPDFTDSIKNINDRITLLEGADTLDTDILTRLFFNTDNIIVVGSRWTIETRSLGSSFILSKGFHGVTGPTFGGILGSIIGSGINFLGDSRGALSVLVSGGNDYSITGSYNPNQGQGGGGISILS